MKRSIFALMMIDLNGFKHINDEFGHAVGDEALLMTARILKSAVCFITYGCGPFA